MREPHMAFRATAYQQRLEEGGVDREQAYALAAAQQEEFIVSELVTRDYLDTELKALEDKLDAKIDTRSAELRAELKAEVATLQVSLIRWVVGTVGGHARYGPGASRFAR
jgi:hypothetical protein